MGKTFLAVIALCASAFAFAKDPVDWVNTETGWISHMLVPTFPTVQRPNSMFRFTAPARTFTDDRVGDFKLSYPGHRNAGVFSFRPYPGDGKFTWDQQRVTPYSYSVYLDSHDIEFKLAPAEKGAIAEIRWEKPGEREVSFGVAKNALLEAKGAAVAGFDLFEGVKVFLFGEFDSAPQGSEQKGGRLAVRFAPETRAVKFRFALSYVSLEQAERNLRREIDGWKLERVADAARADWNAKLGRIEVEGGSDNDKAVFYTALWRCYERMVNITEEGRYRGWDGKIHETKEDGGFDQYTDDWTWDTYRAAHPLMCILDPGAEAAKLVSFIRMTEQSSDGYVPTFPELGHDHHCMNGLHPCALFLDAYRKGVEGVDWKKAFALLAHTERNASRRPWYRGPNTALDVFYNEKGYFPALHPGPDGKWADDPECPKGANRFERRQAVAVTLAGSYDAWCLAELAKDFGTAGDCEEFSRKSQNYRNLWKPDTRFFHPKDAEGKWIEPFDYRFSGGQGARDYYDENNAWTYIWDVPHDIPGLIGLFGGEKNFSAKLDEMFNTGWGMSRHDFYQRLPDSSGMMGMFSMGNEPSFHIPYLYNYAGEPWKTQKTVRKVLKAWFRNDLMGIPGDEDGGGMSAFVVFSMLGIYPVTPGDPAYAIGSPVFEKAVIRPANGGKIVISAPGANEEKKYVKSVSVNGRKIDALSIGHSELMGGKIRFEMSDRPAK